MLRTAGTLCLVAAVGYVALRLVLGVAGGLLGLIFGLAGFAFQALLALGLVYFILTLVAPDAARKVRGILSGPPAL